MIHYRGHTISDNGPGQFAARRLSACGVVGMRMIACTATVDEAKAAIDAALEHTTSIDTETRGVPVANQEIHLYHRWSCSCGASGPWGHSLWAKNSIKSAEQSAQSHVLNAKVQS